MECAEITAMHSYLIPITAQHKHCHLIEMAQNRKQWTWKSICIIETILQNKPFCSHTNAHRLNNKNFLILFNYFWIFVVFHSPTLLWVVYNYHLFKQFSRTCTRNMKTSVWFLEFVGPTFACCYRLFDFPFARWMLNSISCLILLLWWIVYIAFGAKKTLVVLFLFCFAWFFTFPLLARV